MSDKVQRTGDELRAAMTEAKRRGYVIARHITIDDEVPRCCALGAYAIVKGLSDTHGVLRACREPLGLSGEDIVDITDGFDGKTRENYTTWYELGKKLGQEFVR